MDKKPRRRPVSRRNTHTGIRRRFVEALSDTYCLYPRKNLVNHSGDWYTDGHLVEGRPLFAILAMSNYAEYCLYHVKFGRRGQSSAFKPVNEFFFATRRAMYFVLKNFKADRDLSAKDASSLRTRMNNLVELARVAREALKNNKETHGV